MVEPKITRKDVEYVADLAHLELTEAELATYLEQLNSILTYMDRLNQCDISQVEPMAQVLSEAPENFSLREDASRSAFDQATALSNAPESGTGQFKVPKVIER